MAHTDIGILLIYVFIATLPFGLFLVFWYVKTRKIVERSISKQLVEIFLFTQNGMLAGCIPGFIILAIIAPFFDFGLLGFIIVVFTSGVYFGFLGERILNEVIQSKMTYSILIAISFIIEFISSLFLIFILPDEAQYEANNSLEIFILNSMIISNSSLLIYFIYKIYSIRKLRMRSDSLYPTINHSIDKKTNGNHFPKLDIYCNELLKITGIQSTLIILFLTTLVTGF